MRLDGVREVEGAATALRAGHDEQVREAVAVQAEERACAPVLPLLAEGLPTPPSDHVERRGCHPLEACRVDEHVQVVLGAVVHHTALVDLLDPHRGNVHKRHVRLVEAREVLVVERWPLAAVRVVRLQGCSSNRVRHDRVDARTNLFHDAKVGLELLLEKLLGRQLPLVLLALLEVLHLAGQVVVVTLDGRAARRDARETFAPGASPAGLVGPLLHLLLGGGALVTHIDRGWRALEDVQVPSNLRELRDHLYGCCAGADDADALALEVHVIVPT
ncbi:unannotated protein [freshwater metagenome]|uniref:Unannotated protein n=1 Tax=freshwater metagenome TaxID=449393 RepID=A0A6J7EVH8_9ZZZZ